MPIAVLTIARRENRPTIESMCLNARNAGAESIVWALDEEGWLPRSCTTVGAGPGLRNELLNRLFASLPLDFGGYVVVMDDDVVLDSSVRTLVNTAIASRLDIAQPAHRPRSHFSYEITAARPLRVARLTRFVEIGPVVVFSPRGARAVFPLDERRGMGWGMDFEWSKLTDAGYRLGIVDAVLVDHRRPVGGAYLLENTPGKGLDRDTTKRVMTTVRGWWFTQRSPPWSSDP